MLVAEQIGQADLSMQQHTCRGDGEKSKGFNNINPELPRLLHYFCNAIVVGLSTTLLSRAFVITSNSSDIT